ncbi:tyrosine-type recombinase/integrase [Myxococcus sp. 1LA]
METQDQPLAEQVPLFGEPSWAELVRFYDAKYLTRQRTGTSKTRRSMLRHSLEHFGALGVTHPRAADWLTYLNDRVLGGSIMRSTANQHRKVFSHVYEFCREVEGENSWRLLVNPFANGRVPRWAEPMPAPRALAKPGVTYPKLLEAAPDPLARAFFSMKRRHGTRLQETLGLRPCDVNVDAGTLRISHQRQATTVELSPLKTDTSAAVLQLHPETAQLLREAIHWRMAHPHGISGAEFTGKAGELYLFPYFIDHTNRLMNEVCRIVSPSDFPKRIKGVDGGDAWHVFRHTFTVGLIDMGLGLDEIHDWLRHKNPATTTAYLNSLRGRAVGNRERMEALWKAEAQREAELRELSKPGLKLVPHRGR